MRIYWTSVNGLLHHVTSDEDDHRACVAELRAAGYDVTTKEEERS